MLLNNALKEEQKQKKKKTQPQQSQTTTATTTTITITEKMCENSKKKIKKKTPKISLLLYHGLNAAHLTYNIRMQAS